MDRIVSYTMDQSLLNEETLEAMKGGLSYISENVASVSSLQMLPSSYYTISDDSKMIITPGEHMGTVTIKADSAKFLSDPLTLMANYALPFKIVKADADSVLNYKYDNGDGTTTYCIDTLTFRNRIRDGVNEWQDEHPENYN